MLLRQVRGVGRRYKSSALNVGAEERETQSVANSLAERMASQEGACSTIAEGLDQAGRQQLLKALIDVERSQGGGLSSAYVDKLFQHFDFNRSGALERSEFEAAVRTDAALRSAPSSTDAPRPSAFSIALASSIPFIGMGAVDNAIMLVAGSQIDAVLGAKLGLSTLAAAGLGNMVSDVAGVSMAIRIENLTRKMKWFNNAAYKAGMRSSSGRAAKLTGSVVGVSIGCVLGMAPLLFMDTHDQ